MSADVPELSRVPTPFRPRRVGRSALRDRATTSGIEWKRPEEVPGAILTAEAQRRLTEKLRALDEHVGRARVSARNYWITR